MTRFRYPLTFLSGAWVLWLSILIAPAAYPASADGLSLEGLKREALTRNHDLMAARAQVDAARGRLTQAGLRPNPRLELTNESDQPFGNEGQYARGIGVSQDFSIAGRLARAKDVAAVDVARALAEVNEAERQLFGDISVAYYDIVALDQKIALRDRLIPIDESLVKVSTDRQKAGEVSELDVNTASLELQRLEQERGILLGERAAALRILAGIVGFPADTSLAIDTTPPEIIPPPSLPGLTEQALDRRIDLRLLTLAADRARAEMLLANSTAWEDWSVSLGVRQDKLALYNGPGQPPDKALTLGVSIPLPLFNRNQGSRAASAAEAIAAEEQSVALRSRIANEVAGLHEQASRLLTTLNSYTQRTLPLSHRNTDLARLAYGSGQLSMSDFVQAERQENDLNSAYADTLAQYLRALAALGKATVADEFLMTHPVDGPAQITGAH